MSNLVLFINTSKTDLIEVKLIKDGKVIAGEKSTEKYQQAELLLKMIDRVGGNRVSEIGYLRAVAVVSGPGAFSALRFGITTANALAWSLKIPVIDISTEEAEVDKEMIKVVKQKFDHLGSKINDQFAPVVPKYGREANITESRK